MKVSRFVNYIKESIKSNKEEEQLRLIYIIALVSCFFHLMFAWNYHSGCDSYWFNGLDHLRTPLYPFIRWVSWKWPITTILQYCFYLFSIKFFYRTVKELIQSDLFVFITTLLYVIHPVFLMYHNNMQTESLSLSGSVFYIYLLTKCLNNYSHKYCLIYHLIVLLLIFLRPSFIYLLPISSIIFIKQLLFKQKNVLLFISSSFVMIIIILITYMGAIYTKYGVFSISSVGDINLYWMLREKNLLETDNVRDVKLKYYLNNHKDIFYGDIFWNYYNEANEIIDIFGWPALHSVVKSSLQKNMWEFIKHGNHSIEFSSYIGISTGDDCQNSFVRTCSSSINFYGLMFILFIYSVIIITFFLKKKIPWISISFFLIISMHFSTLIIVAPNNYGRLILPSMPLIAIVLMQIVYIVYVFISMQVQKNGKFQYKKLQNCFEPIYP